jgi:hypothetical protein
MEVREFALKQEFKVRGNYPGQRTKSFLRADNYHVSLDYFGKDMYDGRLFQVFFFNTEK